MQMFGYSAQNTSNYSNSNDKYGFATPQYSDGSDTTKRKIRLEVSSTGQVMERHLPSKVCLPLAPQSSEGVLRAPVTPLAFEVPSSEVPKVLPELPLNVTRKELEVALESPWMSDYKDFCKRFLHALRNDSYIPDEKPYFSGCVPDGRNYFTFLDDRVLISAFFTGKTSLDLILFDSSKHDLQEIFDVFLTIYGPSGNNLFGTAKGQLLIEDNLTLIRCQTRVETLEESVSWDEIPPGSNIRTSLLLRT